MRPLAGLPSSEITGRTVCALSVVESSAIAIAIHLLIEMLVRAFIFPHMPGLECSEFRMPQGIADAFRCSGLGCGANSGEPAQPQTELERPMLRLADTCGRLALHVSPI